MPKVVYNQVLERSIEVEVTEAQLASLRDCGSPGFRDAEAYVTDAACAKQHDVALEFVSATCFDSTDNILFDI